MANSKHESAEGYLLGLVVGRGRKFESQKRVLIEFPHKNQFVDGIAHCPKCGWLATKSVSSLKCKNQRCGKPVPQSAKQNYEQPLSTQKSLREQIIPIINDIPDLRLRIGTGNTSTHLIIDFENSGSSWARISEQLSEGTSFHDFRLPPNVGTASPNVKREFVNGLMDTAGFANSGGWLPRDGNNGHGRMRFYFQIVKNWKLAVEIDNFLRTEFGIPIQTIDWGHPNIRSANGLEKGTASVGREHQIKIFPEFMKEFRFRISSKQLLLEELADHNERVGFSHDEDWFPPRPLSRTSIKPSHPAENDPRLPVVLRRHFDSFWQINLALGCSFLSKRAEASANPEIFALTGDTDLDGDPIALRLELNEIARTRAIALKKSDQEKSTQENPAARETPEFDTYEPLRQWLEKYLQDTYDAKSVCWITAHGNLNNFLLQLDMDEIDEIEDLYELRIRPDIVGLIPSLGRLAFIESKVTPIGITEIGQLLGYCLVAQPVRAFLVSTLPISMEIKQLVKEYPDLLTYGDGLSIELMHFDLENDLPKEVFPDAR